MIYKNTLSSQLNKLRILESAPSICFVYIDLVLNYYRLDIILFNSLNQPPSFHLHTQSYKTQFQDA